MQKNQLVTIVHRYGKGLTSFTAVQKAIDNYTLVNLPIWISVEEKMPDIGQFVIVYTKNLVFTKTHYRVTEFTKYGFEVENVTHWILLPKPPEVEN